MFYCGRGVTCLLLIVLCADVGVLPFTRVSAQDSNTQAKAERTPEKLAQEKFLLHQLHGQQLSELPTGELNRLAAETAAQDINDIAVLQNSGLIARQPNNFDLSGRSLTFTPSGRGYLISNNALAFDNNLGNKLNLF